MKNSFLWALAGLIIGVIGTNFSKSAFLILSGTTREDLQKEITELEKRGAESESYSIATSILSRAIRQVSVENPEFKELISKELFLEYMKTQHSTEISKIQIEFDSIGNRRFDRLSTQELNQYKEFLSANFFKKMRESSEGAGQETKDFFDRKSELLRKIVLEEAKAMKN